MVMIQSLSTLYINTSKNSALDTLSALLRSFMAINSLNNQDATKYNNI